jgi:hypothetical protein
MHASRGPRHQAQPQSHWEILMRARCAPLLLYFVFAFVSFLAPLCAHAASTFGPKEYTRGAGPSQTFTDTFSPCGAGSCQLVVVNGNPDGSARVSSASVYLNGVQLVGVRDLNQRVERLVFPVTLAETNEIRVELGSAPGSFLTISVECAEFPSLRVEAGDVGMSRWANGTLSLSIPLRNDGPGTAANVVIDNVVAGGGAYAGPTPFSYPGGTLEARRFLHLAALFTGIDGASGIPLTVTGRYGTSGACPFSAAANVSPPAAGNGGTPKRTTTVPRQTLEGATFGRPMARLPRPLPNAKNVYRPPLGEPRNFFTTPPSASVLNTTKAFTPVSQPPAGATPSEVLFFRNAAGGSFNGRPPEPRVAGATPGGFAMYSANTAVAHSNDRGATFTIVNLTQAAGFTDPSNPARTDFFPEVDGGLCCDQVLHYIPGPNLLVWLIQYWSPAITVGGVQQLGQNRLRIAFATPEAAAANFLYAWSWFDVSPTTLGDTTATSWMDYPDLAHSNDWLYINVDHGIWNAGLDGNGNVIGQQVRSDRKWFVRASLADMASGAGQVNLVYYEPIKTGLVKSHFAQSSPDAMYFAALSDTSTLSVFVDPDSAGTVPTPTDVKITSYCSSAATNPCDYSVTAPDNFDWNVAPHGVLAGAVVVPTFLCPPEGCTGPNPRHVYFGFDGGRDAANGRPFPYVRIARINANTPSLMSEIDIWNASFAFATPALTQRPGTGVDQVAMSLAVGGGGRYADNAVGFLGDFELFMTTNSNVTQTTFGASPAVRYGDYFSVRNAWGPIVAGVGQGLGYSTLGYAVTRNVAASTCPVAGCNVNFQYVLFGRNGELFPTPGPIIK